MALALHLHLPSATRAAAAGVASQQGRRAAHVKQTWLPRRRVAGGGGSACAASSGGEEYGPFQGAFGEWRIEAEDLAEVWAYRGGLTATAAAFATGTLLTLLDDSVALRTTGNALAAGGAAGLGLSLALIHIYVTPLKRLLQALYVVGVAGGLYLAVTHPDMPVPTFVAEHAWATWLVGPAFAALTGVAVKETFCYGKQETLALTLGLPLLLLGHLSGLVPPAAEHGLAAAVAALLLVFAVGKYGQPIKDDIGDKSVFAYYALSPEEQERRIAELQQSGQLRD